MTQHANDGPGPGPNAAGRTRRVATSTGAALALAVASVAASGAAQADQDYVVRAGDTVSHIAARTGTSVAAITRANRLASAAQIRIGQQLTIPGASIAAPAATARPATHAVVSGDTVSGLAARYGTSVAAIVTANALDARALIRVGQQLAIPGAGTTVTPAVTQAGPATHRVASGDTVSAIAARYGTSVAAIVTANALDARALIRVGQQLAIPGAAPAARLVGNTFLGRTYPEAVVASANANKAALLSIGVPSRTQMRAKVVATARAMGVDAALAQAVAFQESGFNHTAVSPANAIGTMQVIPSSGEWASRLVGRHLNLLDPDDNVTAGVTILGALQHAGADLPNTIAGYYQGAASVQRNGMFTDTRMYVAAVQTLMARFG